MLRAARGIVGGEVDECTGACFATDLALLGAAACPSGACLGLEMAPLISARGMALYRDDLLTEVTEEATPWPMPRAVEKLAGMATLQRHARRDDVRLPSAAEPQHQA